ncbi:MAG: RagB/SusD family nutrient uptake outer membrane protein [Mucilaginibacter sp.]|nr:RagB/SusD family nutrient uptake outer membrane protein [Mucilaginibacter sp.]
MKKLLTYIIISFIGLAIFSCKKQLDALPKNAKVEGNVIVDQLTAQVALNGVYYDFADASTTSTGWQGHEVLPASLAGYVENGFGFSSSDLNQNFLITAGYPGYWNECYNTVNAANGFIQGITPIADAKFTGTRKKQMLAEARFLRAYSHFKILNFYGEWYKPASNLGIVIRDKPSVLNTIPKARSSVKDSYAFIIGDLDYAIANCPDSNQVFYASKWAAMALKMRVLMCRAANEDYAQVISLAETLKTGPYALEDKQEDIFHTKGLTSKEVILGITPQATQVSDYYNKSRQYYPGASSLYCGNGRLKAIYDHDPRAAWMIGGAPDYAAYYDSTQVYFMKYIIQKNQPTTVSESDYAFRLTEIYLLEAEAIVRSGGSMSDAKQLVHTIQSKAGITATLNNTNYLAVENANTTDSLLMEIFKETVRSLVAEDGSEWNALLRLPFETVKEIKPTITSQNQYILPVPINEFLYNPLFGDQNPGYSKTQ